MLVGLFPDGRGLQFDHAATQLPAHLAPGDSGPPGGRAPEKKEGPNDDRKPPPPLRSGGEEIRSPPLTAGWIFVRARSQGGTWFPSTRGSRTRPTRVRCRS